MAYERNLHLTIQNEYEELRRHNQEKLEERRRKVYATVPEIEEIDRAISSAGLSIISLAITNPADIEQQVRKLRNQQKELQAKRKALLIENGFSESELTLDYTCQHCQDTGIVGNQVCDCYERRLILKAFEKSNLSQQLSQQSFKTFNLSLFSQEVDSQFGISPYENMRQILSICHNFADSFDQPGKSLLFWGSPGLGKTFLSTCIAKALIETGHSVIYETTYQIVSLLEDYKFKRTDDSTALKAQTQRLYDSDLLILDDLGAEFVTPYTNAALFDILNSRLITGKKTILNTNLDLKELSTRYSERLVSRIIGSYHKLFFFGEDLRLKTQ